MPEYGMWEVLPADPHRAKALAASCGVDPLIGQLLLNRGILDSSAAQRFLAPDLERLADPLVLPDMGRAVSRVRRAVNSGERIVVFGDSDVDGITASAILYEVLTSLRATVQVRLSNRLRDGYGFPQSLVARCARSGIALVIMVDCGTNQVEEIRALAQQGIETVVLDHHVPMERPAEPVALVNPHRDHGAGLGLCSAGLAVKFVQALRADAPERLEQCVDLAALGTLADYAPLLGDNRILVSEGLKRILCTPRPGLQRLCEAVQVTKPTSEQMLQRLVPRLNAPGRLGEADSVWRVLIEPSAQVANRLAERLGEAHATTKALSRQIQMEAHEQASRIHFKHERVMVIGGRGWHPGLMGPLAAQLMERYGRPAIAIALDERQGVGSGRSPSAFNLFEALRSCEGILLRYGGHPQACGLTICAEHLDRLREGLNRHAEATMARRNLVRTLAIDLELSLRDVTPRLASALERLKPFGPGNPKPLALIRGLGVEVRAGGETWLTDGILRRRAKGGVAGLVPGESYDVAGVPVFVNDDDAALWICDARLAHESFAKRRETVTALS